jgi:hypothetical protein
MILMHYFAGLGTQRLDALQIIGDPGIVDLRERVTALALAH